MNMQTLVFDIHGMTCGACITGVQRAIGRLDGVGAVVVELKSGTAAVQIDTLRVTPVRVERAIERLGYAARVRSTGSDELIEHGHPAH